MPVSSPKESPRRGAEHEHEDKTGHPAIAPRPPAAAKGRFTLSAVPWPPRPFVQSPQPQFMWDRSLHPTLMRSCTGPFCFRRRESWSFRPFCFKAISLPTRSRKDRSRPQQTTSSHASRRLAAETAGPAAPLEPQLVYPPRGPAGHDQFAAHVHEAGRMQAVYGVSNVQRVAARA